MTLILHADRGFFVWFGSDGLVYYRQFEKEGFWVKWLQDVGPSGTRNGTQITTFSCENDDYLHFSMVNVILPDTHVYTGLSPDSLDWSENEVEDCP